MIRVALVGCGHMGRLHARTIAAHPLCQLVQVVDIRRERAEQFGANFGAEAVEHPRDVDAVVIATPPSTHAALAREFLGDDRWVLVEKPMATTLPEAMALGTERIVVGHLERFNPAIRALGPVRPSFVQARRTGPRSGRSGDVDVVLDLMIHDIDLLLSWTEGRVEVVDAAGTDDMATVELRGEDGLEARLYASRASDERARTVDVDADGQSWRLDLLHGTIASGDAPPEVAPGPDALTCQWQAFLDGMAGGPRVDAAAGRRAVALADEVRRAIARG